MNAETGSKTAPPLPEEIAMAAYYIWEKEGRLDGHDAEHWQKAEAQVLASRSGTQATGSDPTPPPNITVAILKSLPACNRQRKHAGRNDRRKVAQSLIAAG